MVSDVNLHHYIEVFACSQVEGTGEGMVQMDFEEFEEALLRICMRLPARPRCRCDAGGGGAEGEPGAGGPGLSRENSDKENAAAVNAGNGDGDGDGGGGGYAAAGGSSGGGFQDRPVVERLSVRRRRLNTSG